MGRERACAIVVLYHPNVAIHAKLAQGLRGHRVIAVANEPISVEATAALAEADLRLEVNPVNLGIGAALDQGMRAAVEKADWCEAGRLLREDWSHRRGNVPGISTPAIDRLIGVARRAGSAGAKVCGAGGGGCVFFLVERGAQERVSRAIAQAGAEILPVQVAARGVTIRKGSAKGLTR